MRVTPSLAHTRARWRERNAAAVVDVEALGNAAAQDRAFEDGQEGGDGFAAREGGVGNRSRVASSSSAIRYVLCRRRSSASSTRRPVHDVAHPELVGGVEREAAAVLGRGRVGRARHQARGD